MIDLTPSADQFIEKGSLLLAEPFISDPFFKRTVILVCDHGKEGSFGFVLNNYVEVELSQLIEDFPDDKINVSIGGPVKSSNLFYLHTQGDLIPNSVAIIDGLYFGGDFDVLKEKVVSGEVALKEIRFFLGYSGWGVGQLDDELGEKSWFVTKVNASTIMHFNEKDMWRGIMRKLGKKGQLVANFPEDPELN
jgi:putative transcriptional regulator